ncbi:SHOCT domain-containing protein [Nitrosopumilus sp. S4]
MNKKMYEAYSLGIIGLLVLSVTSSAFAEVSSIQTDSQLLLKGEKITISGNVHDGSNGLVTIVIRDSNNEFVMLAQTMIAADNSFEESIEINDDFTTYGMYSVMGFIHNMTQGVETNFVISQIRETIIPIIEKNEEEVNEKDENILEQGSKEKTIGKKIEDDSSQVIADFVDTTKDPQYYIDRYYNEQSYKSWFDRNYPNLTIEEAVGLESNHRINEEKITDFIDNEIIPKAQATSIVESDLDQIDNSDIVQTSLAVAGLGILFGAVYGVKRKADDNSRQISINRNTIRKKLILPIIGSTPKEVLQMRLVKGEITLEEFDNLKSKLD